MTILFESFSEWKDYCEGHNLAPWEAVQTYESELRGRSIEEIWARLEQTYAVMKDAVQTGLTADMSSRSGMVDNGAKKVKNSQISVLGPQFQMLLSYALSAKEVNSCMGRVVAAPTAGASGIMPGVLVTLEELHDLPKEILYQSMLVSAGIALIIEQRASIAGAVGGCQAETGTAAAMGAGAIVFALGGSLDQVFEAVGITIMNMLGLVCDPVAGLVEIPCIKRNGSAAVIAFASAQMALAGDRAMIPVDEIVDAMGEVGSAMEVRYKETALGGIANTPTAREIEKRVLIQEAEEIEGEE
ncbi:MAG: L-serine ammonia-lyase, iron-sulfur-dependent, subunit alpha [Bacteroidia bacterium]|nr:L-serine ammonia-lyase, iron-sulfur-dependent, subunit alpha [Bacteroidia bacterium]